MRGHESSNAKLTQTQDLGACSPAVQPCRRYSLRLSYTADVPTKLSVYCRANFGECQFGTSGPLPGTLRGLHSRGVGKPLRFPKAPTGLTYGPSLSSEGSAVTDGYALYDVESAPPEPAPSIVPASGSSGSPADVYGGVTERSSTIAANPSCGQKTGVGFPRSMTPSDNPFCLDLPYYDIGFPPAFAMRGSVITWAGRAGVRRPGDTICNRCRHGRLAGTQRRPGF